MKTWKLHNKNTAMTPHGRVVYIIALQVLCCIVGCMGDVYFTLTSAGDSITVSWKGDAVSTYQSFVIKQDGVDKHTGSGSDLQVDGNFVLTSLEYGKQYTVSVSVTLANNSTAELFAQNQNTKPLPVAIGAATEVTTTSLRLSWTIAAVSTQDSFKVFYKESTATEYQVLNTTEIYVVMTDLLPGHVYNFQISAVSGMAESTLTSVHNENTKPSTPNITSLVATSTNTLQVVWWCGHPQCEQDSYEVSYKKRIESGDGTVDQACSQNAVTITECIVNVGNDGQNAGEEYIIMVTSTKGNLVSDIATASRNTKPNKIDSLQLLSRDTVTISIQWSGPAQGKFDNMVVSVSPSHGSASGPSQGSGVLTYTRAGLSSGERYTFSIQAKSGEELSDPESISIYTQPPQVPSISRGETTITSLSVTWTSPTTSSFTKYRANAVKTSDNSVVSGSPIEVTNSQGTDRKATFTGLNPGAQYSITVVTVVGDDVTSPEATESFYIKPRAPTNITLSDSTTSQLTITWSPPPPSSSEYEDFYVKIQDVENKYATVAANSNPLNAIFADLTDGTQYTIVVICRTAGGSARQTSDEIQKSFYTRPKDPTNVRQVSSTTTSITAAWNQPENTDNYDKYIVSIFSIADLSTSLQTAEKAKSTTEHTFNGLEASMQYKVKVLTKIADSASNPASMTMATKPNTPENLSVSDKTTSTLSVTWEAPQGSVEKYAIKIKGNVGGTTVVETEVNGLTFTQSSNLEAGHSYTVELQAISNNIYSDTITQSTTLIPNPPENLQVTATTPNSIQISWNDPINSGFSGFKIDEKNSNGNIIETVELTSSEERKKEFTSLTPGATYTFVIKTLSGSEESAEITIQATTLPSSVAGLSESSKTENSITVTWSKPDTDLTHYDLNISPLHDALLTLPVTIQKDAALEYTFSSLKPGFTYSISIEVVSSDTRSGNFSRDFITKPSAVTGLNVVPKDGASTNTFVVSWNANADSTQDTFQVQYSRSGQSDIETQSVTSVGQTTSYTVDLTGLLSGYEYSVDVFAVSSGVNSQVVTETMATDPKSVTGLTAVAKSSSSVELDWAIAADTNQNATFRVRYRGLILPKNAAFSAWQDVIATSLSLNNLYSGEEYTFEVVAVGNGRTSATSNVEVVLFPLPPLGLSVDRAQTTTDTVVITWTYDHDASYVMTWKLQYTKFGVSDITEMFINDNMVSTMTIGQLIAGQKYTVKLVAVTKDNIESQSAAEVLATVKPSISSVLKEEDQITANSLVAVSYTADTGISEGYRFTINAQGVDPITKTKEDQDRVVKFENLEAGYDYTVTMVTYSGEETSDPKTLVVTTLPNPPQVGATVEPTKIILTIKKPQGGVDEYIIDCKFEGNQTCAPSNRVVPQPIGQDSVDVTWDNLKPHKQYYFHIRSKKGSKESVIESINLKTEEAPPGLVQNFQYTSLSTSSVVLTWDEPLIKNGLILNYRYTYRGVKDEQNHEQESYTEIPPEPRLLEIPVRAGYNYTFEIQAVTAPGPGETASLNVLVPIGPPAMKLPLEASKAVVQKDAIKYNQITYTFVNPFSNENGEVVFFTVIVSADTKGAPTELNTWAESQGKNPPQPFQAIAPCDNFFTEGNSCHEKRTSRKKRASAGDTISFTVGSDAACDPTETQVYCNGPLDPDKTYYVRLRGFTEEGLHADAAVSEPVRTEVKPEDSMQLIIIIVVVVAVVLILVIIVSVILIRRGVCSSRDDEVVAKPATGMRLGSFRNSSRRKRRIGEINNPVKIGVFPEHVREMSADTDFKFSEEFEDLKHVGREQATNASELPVNRNKNRFTNILPYDHSRVKLLPTDDEEGTDYINANYMPGFNSKREFIVTQGALPSTRDDFWRMTWEQSCRAIVMLTKCVEKGREKCDHYWPVDSEPMFYGDLQVTVLNETKCPEWIVTEFKISKGEVSRKVAHFHYTAWPDFGVPEKPQSLVRFVRLVRSKLAPHGGPIVVHCSAGVGRSGAYIAIDRIIQSTDSKVETLDIFGLVYEMRQYRPHMVQTEQQYICIHNCILCVIEGREDEAIIYPGQDNEAFDDDEGITIDN